MANDLMIYNKKLSVNSLIIIITLTLGSYIYLFDIAKEEAIGLPNKNWTQSYPSALQLSSNEVEPLHPNVSYAPNFLILYNINLIDSDGKIRPNSTIIIKENEIVDLSYKGNITKFYFYEKYPNSTLIDLSGKYLLPGLFDMHAHVAGVLKNSFNQTYSEETLHRLLAYGITTIRNPGGPTDQSVSLRDNVSLERIIGPQIFTAGSLLNSPVISIPFVEKKVNSVSDIHEEITNQANIGVDFIKLYVGLTPVLTSEAIDKAHSLGLGVIGHLYLTSWNDAANNNIDFLTHGVPVNPYMLSPQNRERFMEEGGGPFEHFRWLELVNINGKEITEMIKNLVENNVFVDPTLSVYESMIKDNPLYAKNIWTKVLGLTKKMHDNGVKLLSGTDIPNFDLVPGKSLHHELQLLTDAGIPTSDIIQIATRNGAEALKIVNSTGTIEEGKQADMVVLSSNPIENISNTKNIDMIINNGKIIDRISLLSR
ncbi:amidohydrolase family protein [Candidatus Nitrosocosmicus sp. T]